MTHIEWLNRHPNHHFPASGGLDRYGRTTRRSLRSKPFTDEDLARIFGSEEFKRQETRHPERYWMLLILLHTGARREEIAQLCLSDIRQDVPKDGSEAVWFFEITPDEGLGKALKTQGSKRRVPIHSG